MMAGMDLNTYTLRVQNAGTTLIMRFPSENDDEALFQTIDLVLWKAQNDAEPWMTGKITLHNALGVVLLTVPDRSRSMVDDDGCDDVF